MAAIRDLVLLDGVRTPMAEFNESFADVSAIDLAAHAARAGYPILPCRLCGTQENLKRDRIAALLADLEREIPDVRSVMLAALKNVRASHLLDAEMADAWESQADRFPPRR